MLVCPFQHDCAGWRKRSDRAYISPVAKWFLITRLTNGRTARLYLQPAGCPGLSKSSEGIRCFRTDKWLDIQRRNTGLLRPAQQNAGGLLYRKRSFNSSVALFVSLATAIALISSQLCASDDWCRATAVNHASLMYWWCAAGIVCGASSGKRVLRCR